MPRSLLLGEFEQIVLLAILNLDTDDAFAIQIHETIAQATRSRISRGALYRTLDRLGDKGYVCWETEPDAPGRGGHPRRVYEVTPEGMAALRRTHSTLSTLWQGARGLEA